MTAEIISLENARKVSVAALYGPKLCGEGPHIGKQTVVIATGGCDFRCSWCDFLYGVMPENVEKWQQYSAHELFERVTACSLEPILVTITGGNPALQNLQHLIEIGHTANYTFSLETQGSIVKPWFSQLDFLVLSPKPPSSKMKTDWDALDRCCEVAAKDDFCDVSLKIVVFDDRDYDYAHKVADRYPFHPLYLQVGRNPHTTYERGVVQLLETTRWLSQKVSDEHWNDAIVLPQLQVLLWESQENVGV